MDNLSLKEKLKDNKLILGSYEMLFIKKPLTRFFYRHMPIKKNKVIFDSLQGRDFSCNPKYIAIEAIKENKKWDMVWLSRKKPDNLPKEIRWVKYETLNAYKEWSTAKVWVINTKVSIYPPKRDKQKYLQTWHASGFGKLVCKDIISRYSEEQKRRAEYDGSITDAILSDYERKNAVYKRAFWIRQDTEILQIGMPRNDFLLNHKNDDDLKRKLRKQFCSDDCFLVLYAPTFRDNDSLEGYIFEFDKIIEGFEKSIGKECRILVRMHPEATKLSEKYTFSEKVINVSNYPDAQELALATDCTISDYSTIIFDAIRLDNLAIIYMPDYDSYTSTRKLDENFLELPFFKTKNFNELIDYVSKFSYDKYREILDNFNRVYLPYDDGNASKNCVKWIDEQMK